jgi:hypothetical protein
MNRLTIISGGQSGADEGGLAGAAALGIPTGGFMPRGFRREDDRGSEVAARYGLKEHSDHGYAARTRENVATSDATVWIGRRSPGFTATCNACNHLGKPFWANPSPEQLRAWTKRDSIRVLNVAGNRESLNPGIREQVKAFIIEAFGEKTL